MNQQPASKSGIFFSCTEEKLSVKEHLVPSHVVTHVYSGKLQVTEPDKKYMVNAGDTVLFVKNHLAKITKFPGEEAPFKSITIFFTQPFLQAYCAQHDMNEHHVKLEYVKQLNTHPLLESLFNSVLPYYDIPENLPDELVDLKMKEAITILRKIDPSVDGILCNFAAPGKMDISEFMNQHYKFNLPLDRFAFLTGRSLSTFKRDFQKTFHMSPQRWLQQKRLEQAHFLIAEHKQKPSDVYIEVGFENLSHFSHAFKQTFGYNPSSL